MRLVPSTYEALAGWAGDDHEAALETFARHADKPTSEHYRHPDYGIAPNVLLALSLEAKGTGKEDARQFFETRFRPALVEADPAASKVTGFFEPELDASARKTTEFHVPVYARPHQLVDAKGEASKHVPDGYRFVWRRDDGSFDEAPDRAAIGKGALDQEPSTDIIAWLADPIDAFFMHVQGAARLKMTDGTIRRITYAAKSGHPFTGIGRLLVEAGEIAATNISMHTIDAWLRANPERAKPLMHENRSYIFFKDSAVGDMDLGPFAAAKIQLTAGRSLAVDLKVHTFGTPIHVAADTVNDRPWQSLMVAQETGTAIVGAQRGDIFFGTGTDAGRAASAVNSPCRFTILIPNSEFDRVMGRWNR